MTLESYEYKGLTVRVVQDEYAESPREWDNLGTMVCNHGRYNLGDEQLECHGVSWNDDLKHHLAERDMTLDDVIYLPLYLYDHSGITMNTTGFTCSWDSGQVGWIYVPKYVVRANYGVKKISKQLREKMEQYLRGEVETYDAYLTGEVYGYVLEDCEGSVLDACNGFYDIDECKAEAEAWADSEVA